MSILAWIVLGLIAKFVGSKLVNRAGEEGISGHRDGNRWCGSWGLAVQHLRSPRRHGCKPV